jgi:hypothetical protein
LATEKPTVASLFVGGDGRRTVRCALGFLSSIR